MRIASDAPLSTQLSRPFDAARESARATEPVAATSAIDSQRLAAQAQRIAATGQVEKSATRESGQAEREADNRRFAREAPNGQRPRYVPKGQSLNILV